MVRMTDKTEALPTEADFAVRKNAFLLPFGLALLICYSLLFFAGMGLRSGNSLWMYGTLLLIVLLGLAALIVNYSQKQQDLVTFAEFQNTLFASTARLNWHFCLIIKSDGSVAYIDPGFKEIFPQLNPRNLTDVAMLGQYALLTEEQQRVFDKAIRDHVSTFVIANLPQGEDKNLKFVVTLEPLSRPKGYFSLRGRPFVERHQRTQIAAEVSTPEASSNATLPSPSFSAANDAFSASSALATLIEASPIAMAAIDAEGKILDCNENFRNLAHRTRHRKDGWNFVETLSAAYREEFFEQLKQHSSSHSHASDLPLDIRIQGEKEGDKENAASLYIGRLQLSASMAPCFLLHLIDTTEQKNLELKYTHSQKMQAVGQLAGGVAHDFNNLLTAMIGFCDLLLMRHPAGDQSFPDIMQVKQNANRAANLVRQLLAFSRRQTLQPKLLDMTEVLAELSNLIRRLIGENIELKVIHGRDIGMVKADQGQLEQVMINLAVNARDAMAGGGGALTLRTSTLHIKNLNDLERGLIAPADDDQITAGEYVLVEISDTGTGISPENIQKIFEPFFSTKEVGAGTGLGLATVYGIIKQTGGYLYVHSQLGVGTKFQLYFPRYEASPQEAALEEKVEKEPQGDLTGMGTILLVEDEAPVRNFAARALRNKGYTVLEADCGEAALEIVVEQGNALDIIVSDVIMPGMNGPEMIKRIMPEHPKVKVIFISGYAEDAFTDSFGEDYQFNFLPKPFTLKQLASKVKEVLSGVA